MMWRLTSSSAIFVALLGHQAWLAADACTVIAAGREATTDGSTLMAHTDDAGSGAADIRIVRVPSQDHPKGSKRAVYNFFGGFPRLVSDERGEHYKPKSDNEQLMKPMGYIPQVDHTYAYWDQDYGMMNEVQLSIGESTCGAKTVGWPLDAGSHGKNLFGIAELSKVALERCDSARCAVQTMGDLAVQYGFFSEDSDDPAKPDYGDSAEALGIADKYGEVWIFHVLTGKDNSSAVWAAQRLRDDHVTTIANGFTIREIDLGQPDWFMASSNVFSFAEEMGWWNARSGARFDFTKAYGFAEKDAVGPLYTGRRVWRVFDVVAPSLHLDSRLGSFSEYETYPFSVRPDKQVDIETFFALLRDHYEGTPYDMTKGLAAGPFGAPVRWATASQGVQGGWERPISMYRTMFAFVLQSRKSLPDAIGGIAWYAQGSPHGSVFVPLSCAQEAVPESYLIGRQSQFHPQSAWWAFNFVNNWSLLRFDTINADVRREAIVLQAEAKLLRSRWEHHALRMISEQGAEEHDLAVLEFMEEKSNAFATKVVDRWWAFAWELVARYSDGYKTIGEQPSEQNCPGYPAWWLQASEYSKWPGDTFTPRFAVSTENAAVQTNTLRSDTTQVKIKPTVDVIAEPARFHASSPAPIQSVPSRSKVEVAAPFGFVALGSVLGALTLSAAQSLRRRGYSALT